MPSQVFKRGPATPAFNITPLIDVVFLLIIFFMLVTNILAKEAVRLMVPELEDPRTQAMSDAERIVVSVAPRDYNPVDRTASEDPLLFDGEPQWVQVGLRRFQLGDIEGITAAVQQYRESNSEAEVLLRADGALYYDGVQPIMAAITGAGITRVNLVALMPETAP